MPEGGHEYLRGSMKTETKSHKQRCHYYHDLDSLEFESCPPLPSTEEGHQSIFLLSLGYVMATKETTDIGTWQCNIYGCNVRHQHVWCKCIQLPLPQAFQSIAWLALLNRFKQSMLTLYSPFCTCSTRSTLSWSLTNSRMASRFVISLRRSTK